MAIHSLEHLLILYFRSVLNFMEMKKLILSFLTVGFVIGLNAQCLVKHIPLKERVETAEFIVEVEVIKKESFISKADDRIYTKNTALVYKQFKGQKSLLDQQIDVFTLGGQFGDRMEMAEPSLQFNLGVKGVLLLANSELKTDIDGKSQQAYWGVSGPTSFIGYHILNQDAIDHHDNLGNIHIEFYPLLSKLCGIKNPQEGTNGMAFPQSATLKKTVTSFSPSTVIAGNRTVLTITGSGFGSSQGKVTFANGNDGGKTLLEISDARYFTKWSDKEVKVYVPRQAGTGKISVIDGGGSSHQSSSSLTITYSLLEFETTTRQGDPTLVTPVLDGDNGKGITWTFNEDFFKNKDAVNTFTLAVESWRCATLVNFDVDLVNTTKIDIVDRDDVHTVMWQNPNQQINGSALGVTYSQWSACLASDNDWHWYLDDVDMVFDDALSNGRTWNYGNNPSSSQYDFESVALHELGHAHQLGHIIDASGVMHYSIKNGEKKRTLKSTVDIAAGNEIMTNSIVSPGCNSYDVMTKIKQSECKILNVTRPGAAFTALEDRSCGVDSFMLVNTSDPTGNLAWSVDGGTILKGFVTDDTVLVTASNTGKYTVKLVVELDGFYDSTTVDVEFLKDAEIVGAKVTDVSCFGQSSGEVSMLVDGTQPITVKWLDNNSSQNPRKNLPVGIYNVELSDKNGCKDQGTFEVKEPAKLEVTTDGNKTWGEFDKGRAWVNITGGTKPYKVLWSDANASTTDTISDLPQGLYLAKVTDKNDCAAQETYQVERLPVDMAKPEMSFISIFPNPTTGNVFVKNEYAHDANIWVMNSLGQTISTHKVFSGQSIEIELEGQPNGVYLIKSQSSNVWDVQEVVKR